MNQLAYTWGKIHIYQLREQIGLSHDHHAEVHDLIGMVDVFFRQAEADIVLISTLAIIGTHHAFHAASESQRQVIHRGPYFCHALTLRNQGNLGCARTRAAIHIDQARNIADLLHHVILQLFQYLLILSLQVEADTGSPHTHIGLFAHRDLGIGDIGKLLYQEVHHFQGAAFTLFTVGQADIRTGQIRAGIDHAGGTDGTDDVFHFGESLGAVVDDFHYPGSFFQVVTFGQFDAYRDISLIHGRHQFKAQAGHHKEAAYQKQQGDKHDAQAVALAFEHYPHELPVSICKTLEHGIKLQAKATVVLAFRDDQRSQHRREGKARDQ